MMDDISSSDSDTTSSDSSSSSVLSSDSETSDSAVDQFRITFKHPVKQCQLSTSEKSAVGISKNTKTMKMWEEVSKTGLDPSAQPSTFNKKDEGISESSSSIRNQRISSNQPSTSITNKEEYSLSVVVPDNIGLFMLLESIENRVGAICNDKDLLQNSEDVTDTKNGILMKCTTFKSFVTSKAGNFMIHQGKTPNVQSYPDILPMPRISCTCSVEGFILKWDMPPVTPTYSYAKPVYYDIFWCPGNAKKLTEECIWHYFASVKAEDQPMQSLLEECYFEDHVYNFAIRSRDVYNSCGMCSDPLKVIRIIVH